MKVPLPDDRMVVSIAPYIGKTHPCSGHSPSGCQGEITDAEVLVHVYRQDGSVFLEENRFIQPNGFTDLWLPKGQEFRVKLDVFGRSAEGTIGTFDDSNTCITTFKIS